MSVVNIGRSREPKRVINTTLISSSGVTWFKVRIRNTLLIPTEGERRTLQLLPLDKKKA